MFGVCSNLFNICNIGSEKRLDAHLSLMTHPQNPHGKSTELTLTNYSFTSTYLKYLAPPHTPISLHEHQKQIK